jgi:elongation factor G
MVAEADEALMEKFFEAGTLTQEELGRGLATATRASKIFPLVCTSGLANIGAQALMDASSRICRRPRIARSARSPAADRVEDGG